MSIENQEIGLENTASYYDVSSSNSDKAHAWCKIFHVFLFNRLGI